MLPVTNIFNDDISCLLGEWGDGPAMHFAYYKIQMNESLVAKDQRQELFYMRWLKKKIPALKGIGIPEEDDHKGH
ncbi:hypothetical protein Tcan_14402 [Toxocara canis]|uniref:Uncharacterized protein n=2 Tax=Toxocara canis TaxID=6265 RepID=A0A0B2VQC6_TOXCA|nr:hypothetical protein Tcan_14402 [Toxocara canis]